MLEPDAVDLLESGCGMLVGFITAAGTPFATRGWGMKVQDDGTRVRVLVGRDEVARLGYAPGGEISTMVAVTGCNVLTLRSAQLKGPIISIEPANDDDRERSTTYCDAFFDDVAVVDSVPRYLMERLVPATQLACTFEIVEAYDQTPGPNAGAPMAAKAT
jgi:hypothetical protein